MKNYWRRKVFSFSRKFILFIVLSKNIEIQEKKRKIESKSHLFCHNRYQNYWVCLKVQILFINKKKFPKKKSEIFSGLSITHEQQRRQQQQQQKHQFYFGNINGDNNNNNDDDDDDDDNNVN